MSSRASSRSKPRLEDIAPRLARAHRARRLELERERDARLRAAQRVLKAERLVAHRELQLARGELNEYAAAGRSANQRRHRRNYTNHRAGKLEQARAELERARQRARALGLGA